MRSTKITFILLCFGLLTDLAAQNHANCEDALFLCSTQPLSVPSMSVTVGENTEEIGITTCSPIDFKEKNSSWLYWTVAKGGELGFHLNPINASDDLDFILFRLEDKDVCGKRELLRCMASGAELGDDKKVSTPCSGMMGLSAAVSDTAEQAGCSKGDDNYLASISTQLGQSYALLVVNHNSTTGFKILFTGSTQFAPQTEHCREDYTRLGSLWIGQLYPNPATSYTILNVEAQKASELNIRLLDAQGKTIRQWTEDLITGSNPLRIPMDRLSIGYYFIHLSNTDGEMQLGVERI